MTAYDAIVVFGSKLQKNGRFPPFVYRELDEAVRLRELSSAPRIVVCGSHAMNHGRRGLPPESEVAAAYLMGKFPGRIPELWKEGDSTNLPENWLYLRRLFINHGIKRPRLLLVTIAPLLPRLEYLSECIFGNEGAITFATVPHSDEWPKEPLILGDTKCILRDMKPGDYRFLLNANGESRWEELRNKHHSTCPYRGKLHPFS